MVPLMGFASEGIYFTHAYVSAPSFSPSRAAVLTGRNGYELEGGGVLYSYLPVKFQVYPKILRQNGYWIGFTGKGWGPGDLEIANRQENPAGKTFKSCWRTPESSFGADSCIYSCDYFLNFKQFLIERPKNKSFCF